jgi:hypothetical protein
MAKSLIGEVLLNRKLPSKGRILASIGKDFLGNPAKAIKEGFARDRAAVKAYQAATGRGRLGALLPVVKAGYQGGGKDLIVNTGGYGGSVIGANIGALPGALAGDYFGARIVRRGLEDLEAGYRGIKKARQSPDFISQSIPDKIRTVGKAIQEARPKKTPELTEDTVGWAIGNSAANALQSAGSHVPLQGGLVAMATGPSTVRAVKVGRRVKDARKATVSGARHFYRTRIKPLRNIGGVRRIIKGTVDRGLARERKAYDKVNNELQRYLPDVKNINFCANLKTVWN